MDTAGFAPRRDIRERFVVAAPLPDFRSAHGEVLEARPQPPEPLKTFGTVLRMILMSDQRLQ
ncbi:MAG TPA: hypothetical protein PK902_12660, partial [Actinomycetota bacterium]|nr:hypothetical protein [Actinomycetota bacterium]